MLRVDPRVHAVLETSLPLIWDQRILRKIGGDVIPKISSDTVQSPWLKMAIDLVLATDQFLDAAMSYGIASGVAIPVRDSRGHGSMTALSSESPAYDAARLALVNHRLGEIVLFAQCLHEIFSAAILQCGIAPLSRGTPLSG
jgi:autoinducer binding domain-containing protein